MDKNTIIFPAEYNPTRPELNAIIKRHEHILKHFESIFKTLF